MMTRNDWENVPVDPDPVRDLRYELAELDVLEPVDGGDQLLFLPRDEEALKREAFIIASMDSVYEVGDLR